MCVCCGGLGSGLGSAQEGTTVRVSASPRKGGPSSRVRGKGGGALLINGQGLVVDRLEDRERGAQGGSRGAGSMEREKKKEVACPKQAA